MDKYSQYYPGFSVGNGYSVLGGCDGVGGVILGLGITLLTVVMKPTCCNSAALSKPGQQNSVGIV